MQRVKVYRLNDEGKWDDKGTGHVSVEYLEVIFTPDMKLHRFSPDLEKEKHECQ
jgi:hypothetical protein